MSDRLKTFGDGGPVTVVHRANASTADRSRALSPHAASRVISRLFGVGDRDASRQKLCDLHRIAAGDLGVAYSRADTSRLTEQVLTAVSNGTIMVLDGWMMGTSWTPRCFAAPGGEVSDDDDPESTSEVRIARRAMGGRQGDLAFEGARYRLLPVLRWRKLKEQGAYEVVPQEEAAAILQRMTLRPGSADQKAALGEAAEILADTGKTFVLEGLFLARRSSKASVASITETAAVSTPSQIAKEIEWVETVDPVMDGGMVHLDLSEVELPVDSDAAEETVESEDDDAPGDPDGLNAGGESEAPEQSHASADDGP